MRLLVLLLTSLILLSCKSTDEAPQKKAKLPFSHEAAITYLHYGISTTPNDYPTAKHLDLLITNQPGFDTNSMRVEIDSQQCKIVALGKSDKVTETIEHIDSRITLINKKINEESKRRLISRYEKREAEILVKRVQQLQMEEECVTLKETKGVGDYPELADCRKKLKILKDTMRILMTEKDRDDIELAAFVSTKHLQRITGKIYCSPALSQQSKEWLKKKGYKRNWLKVYFIWGE